MNTQICAIDNGYSSTKVFDGKKLFKFNSRVQETSVDISEALEMDGKRYKIGKGTEDIELDKTSREIHKICTWAALAQCTEETAEYRLVVGLPLMHYLNKEIRESFKSYILTPNIKTVRYNGNRKIIKISNCLVFAQGAAALFEHNRLGLCGVLDWGGLTVNGFVAEDMEPIRESMFTVNLGTMILFSRIKTQLNERLGLNIQDYEIPYIIKERKYKEVTETCTKQHIEDIRKEMRKKNWSIETLNIIGVGGGFEVAGQYFPNIDVVHNPVYANVKGLYKVGCIYYAETDQFSARR